MKKALGHILSAILAVCILFGCVKDDEYFTGKRFSRVMLVYTAAYNNLSSEINSNISDLARSVLPLESGDKCVLVVTHNSKTDYDFTTPTNPCLVRLYSDWEGNNHRDTVMVMEPDAKATDPYTINYVLDYVKEHYPSDHYGLIYSSHGSGWTPEGYYNSPSSYSSTSKRRGEQLRDLKDIPEYVNGPAVKSIGASMHSSGDKTVTYETDLMEFAAAIPYHLDYIVLDACLMGGIETAYELREKADKIVFSQAEILSAGFPYSNMTLRLLRGGLDVEGVAEDYYDYYQNSPWRSATVSVVDCRYLDELKDCCNALFSKYRSAIAAVDASQVQGFFRMGRCWFYDLEDILVKSGISDEDLAGFRGIMDNLITYKAHTARILDTFDINTFCGLSMYLPSKGSSYLDSYYGKLAWQKGTGLVN